jgi:predicted metal-binding protein
VPTICYSVVEFRKVIRENNSAPPPCRQYDTSGIQDIQNLAYSERILFKKVFELEQEALGKAYLCSSPEAALQ